MSGHGFGHGFGLNWPGGTAGGGGSGPAPGALSDMVVWIAADASFETAIANHTPGTPYHCLSTQVITNMASGGPTLSFNSASADERPYYHTADWGPLTTGESAGETISQPNGHPFMASNRPSDSGLTTCDRYRIDFGSLTTSQTDYSGISVQYMESSGLARRCWENLSGGGSYFRLDSSEDAYFHGYDSSASAALVQNYAQDATRRFWMVWIWRHANSGDANPGMQLAYNGYRRTMTALSANIDNAMQVDTFAPYTQWTTGWTDHILYEAAHSLDDLDVVAAQFATKYGITYTVSTE